MLRLFMRCVKTFVDDMTDRARPGLYSQPHPGAQGQLHCQCPAILPPHAQEQTPLNTGVALGITGALAISLTNVASRAHFDAGSTPSTFLIGRYIIFVAGLGVLLMATKSLYRLERADTVSVMLAGSLNFIGATCLAFSIQRMPVSLAIAVLYLFPFFSLFISAYLDRQTPDRRTLATLSLAFLGLSLALGIGRGDTPDALGLLFALLAALGVSTSFICIERKLSHVRDGMRLLGISTVGLVGAVALGGLSADVVWPLPSPHGWSTFLAAALSFALASTAMFMAVSRIGATTTGLLMNLEPPATAVLAMMLLGDSLTRWQLLGILIVIAAVLAARGTASSSAKH